MNWQNTKFFIVYKGRFIGLYELRLQKNGPNSICDITGPSSFDQA